MHPLDHPVFRMIMTLTRRMEIVIGALLVVAIILQGSIAANAKKCPQFSCKPGTFVPGHFLRGRLSEYYLDANDLTAGECNNVYLTCYKKCIHYNRHNSGWKKARYWQFERTCRDNSGALIISTERSLQAPRLNCQ